nr:SDR family NAD(P)-dependent oxidoreductase [Phytohabitans suffuscus]
MSGAQPGGRGTADRSGIGLVAVGEPGMATADVRLGSWLDRRLRRCDVLVNNAAALFEDDGDVPADVDLNLVRRTLETNLFGTWHLTQTIAPLMRARRYGRIVNISSGLASLTSMERELPAYRVSKCAVNALTRMVADELAGEGILVNACCLGPAPVASGNAGDTIQMSTTTDTAKWLAASRHLFGDGLGQLAKKRDPGELGLVPHAELGADALDVRVDRVRADAEPGGDLPVGQPVGDLAEHLLFAFGEVQPGRVGALRRGRSGVALGNHLRAGCHGSQRRDQAFAGLALACHAGGAGPKVLLGGQGPVADQDQDRHGAGGLGDMSQAVMWRKRVGVEYGGIGEPGRFLGRLGPGRDDGYACPVEDLDEPDKIDRAADQCIYP